MKVYRIGVMNNCLKLVEKVLWLTKNTMVVMIGRMVDETYFRRNVWIGSRSHCLFGEA